MGTRKRGPHVDYWKCGLCGKEGKSLSGYQSHMAKHSREGDLHKDCYTGKQRGIMATQGDDYVRAAVEQLFATGAVALEVDDPKLFRKQRIDKQVLFVTLGRLYGDPRAIVYSLVGGGCEISRLDDLKITPLIRIGLHSNTAAKLVEAIGRHLEVNEINVEYYHA